MFDTNPQLQKARFEQIAQMLFAVETERCMLEKANLQNDDLIAKIYEKIKSQPVRPQQQFYIGTAFE